MEAGQSEPGSPGSADRPRPDGGDIRKLTSAEIGAAARTLALAFEDDPHFRWIIRDGRTRLSRLERGFAIFIRGIWLRPDEGYVHDRQAGAALWMPPGTWHVGILAQARMAPATTWVLRADTPRLLRALNFIERQHPRQPDHWYLPAVGVRPEWQGRGYGAALMRPVLERCDRDRVPAYLEASTPRNRALYERQGFKVTDECRYAKDGPPLWPMWREPA